MVMKYTDYIHACCHPFCTFWIYQSQLFFCHKSLWWKMFFVKEPKEQFSSSISLRFFCTIHLHLHLCTNEIFHLMIFFKFFILIVSSKCILHFRKLCISALRRKMCIAFWVCLKSSLKSVLFCLSSQCHKDQDKTLFKLLTKIILSQKHRFSFSSIIRFYNVSLIYYNVHHDLW